MVRESSSEKGNRRRRESTSRVMVLEGSKDKVSDIVVSLGTVFRQKAPEQGVRVIRGSRGSCPYESHAMELVFTAWDRLPQNEKDALVAGYVDGYITRIKTNRPNLLHVVPEADAHGK